MAVHLHRILSCARGVSAGHGEMSNAFAVLVGSRSWDWLMELCRPLGVQAQLVDASSRPQLPPETPAAGPAPVSEAQLGWPGEVGLLLPDTNAAHAALVAGRLRSSLGAMAAARASIRAIGVATRLPGDGVAEGILNDARANAQRRPGNGTARSAAS